MTPPMSSADRFALLISNLAQSAHGSKELKAVKNFLSSDLKKSNDREAFLFPKLIQSAITWETVRTRVWKDQAAQDTNKFPFLQGDIVGTTAVLALGIAESTQTHDLWMVLSPDCDCVRASYVRVAPVFPVFSDERADTLRTQRFGYALKLSSPKAFPLPPLPGDHDPALRGYFADLGEPFFITSADKGLATPYASMTITAWHLLNGLIQENETRAADIAEATAIRRH